MNRNFKIILMANFMELTNAQNENQFLEMYGEDVAPHILDSLSFDSDWNSLIPVLRKCCNDFPESEDLDLVTDSIYTFSLFQVFESISDYLAKHWIPILKIPQEV
jgi:hypothetical protein